MRKALTFLPRYRGRVVMATGMARAASLAVRTLSICSLAGVAGVAACNRDPNQQSAGALYNTVVLDATTTGLGEYVAQTMGGGRLADQYMPLVKVIPADSLAAAESLAVRETREGKYSGYLVIDSNSVRAKSARYWGKRADVKEEMELIRGAIKENVLAMEMRNRGIDSALVDSLTARPVELKVEAAK